MSHPISVVIPTAAGWPRIRQALDPLLTQLRAHRGQLVIADVSGLAVPSELRGADVVWLEQPGEWVIRARRRAYELTDAPIVAITEDHCVVADDWVARILAAHARHPEAAAITGAVENGTRQTVSEWALYIGAHVRLAPPLPAHPPMVGKTNISYKRDVLLGMPSAGPASIEDIFNQRLRAAGLTVLGDDSIRVAHHQSGGPLTMTRLQFHNGRTIAALRRSEMGLADILRALLPVPLAAFRLARTLHAARAKRLPAGVVAAAVPLLAVMLLAHAAGEALGYLLGPGDSPLHLH